MEKATERLEDIELVIFDLDGVLVDTERISISSWIEAFSEYNYELDYNIAVKRIGSSLDKAEDYYKDKKGNTLPYSEIKSSYYMKLINGIKTDKNLLKKGAIDLLNYLDISHIKKAVASSSSRDRVIESLKAAKIADCFDIILCGDDVKNCKPDPEIHLTICSKLGVNIQNALIIEDSDIGVKAASNAGIKCILVPDLKENPPECFNSCVAVVENLNDIKQLMMVPGS